MKLEELNKIKFWTKDDFKESTERKAYVKGKRVYDDEKFLIQQEKKKIAEKNKQLKELRKKRKTE